MRAFCNTADDLPDGVLTFEPPKPIKGGISRDEVPEGFTFLDLGGDRAGFLLAFEPPEPAGRDATELKEYLRRVGAELHTPHGPRYLVRCAELKDHSIFMAKAVAPSAVVALEDIPSADVLEALQPVASWQALIAGAYAMRGGGFIPGAAGQDRTEPIKFLGSKGWLPITDRGVLLCVYGLQGAGKTTFLVNELMHLAVKGEACILYVGVDGTSNMKPCVIAAYERHVRDNIVPAFKLFSPPNQLDLGNDGEAGWEQLEREIASAREMFADLGSDDDTPLVIVIETLNAVLCGADENGTGAQRFLARANALVKAQGVTMVYTHHGAERPRGSTAQLGNVDRALRVVQRQQNRLVTVSTMPNGPNGKDRLGPGGQEFARFKMGAYTTRDGDTVGCPMPIAPEAKPEVPEACPAEFRDAWLALDSAGASDGLDHDGLTAVLGKLAEASVKPGSTPDAIRKRRTRMMGALLEAGLLVAGGGDVYQLRS